MNVSAGPTPYRFVYRELRSVAAWAEMVVHRGGIIHSRHDVTAPPESIGR